jgi:hypothetical protein
MSKGKNPNHNLKILSILDTYNSIQKHQSLQKSFLETYNSNQKHQNLPKSMIYYIYHMCQNSLLPFGKNKCKHSLGLYQKSDFAQFLLGYVEQAPSPPKQNL